MGRSVSLGLFDGIEGGKFEGWGFAYGGCGAEGCEGEDESC